MTRAQHRAVHAMVHYVVSKYGAAPDILEAVAARLNQEAAKRRGTIVHRRIENRNQPLRREGQ